MRFLVDNQLPAALARWLAARGADAVHVLDIGFDATLDSEIWTRAILESRIVVSKDEDFLHLANRLGDEGSLLWVRTGNCRTMPLLARFEAEWSAIEQAFASGQRVVELR